MKAIRGATSVENNEREEITARTIELMEEIFAKNDIWEIHSVIFTVTRDVTAFNRAFVYK
jgi:chorismate mutase